MRKERNLEGMKNNGDVAVGRMFLGLMQEALGLIPSPSTSQNQAWWCTR